MVLCCNCIVHANKKESHGGDRKIILGIGQGGGEQKKSEVSSKSKSKADTSKLLKAMGQNKINW